MTDLHRRLLRDLVALLLLRIYEYNSEAKAAAFLEDMGMDDCPVCLANRRREAWVG